MSIERIDLGPWHMSAAYRMTLAERQTLADFETYEKFKEVCAVMQAGATIPWSPKKIDWSNPERGTPMAERPHQLWEMMVDSLDYPSGPGMDEAMDIILHAAKSKDEWIAKPAKELIQRMATTWARYNTPEVDDDL